ncbi:MAG TPA: hypothetical protein VM840_05220 [Actinomycetota bacterium]|nr:hypothetical protein [Actinomycetota bacterium]
MRRTNPFMRRLVPLAALAVIAVLPVSPAAASALRGCVGPDVHAAARGLVSEHARVEAVEAVAGFRTALVSDPVLVGSEATHRLVSSRGSWCPVEAFDAVWVAEGRRGDAVARASAFAALAGETWFGRTTVRTASALPGGVVRLVTHGERNGVLASWTVHLDRAGVRAATWTATQIAVRPFAADASSLTALPGASRTFLRRGPTLSLQGPLIPQDDDLELHAEAKMSDGFTVQVRNGDAPIGVVTDTGLHELDIVRHARDAAAANYEEFLAWGLTGSWEQRTGVFAINDALSLYCIACVAIQDQFNIHMSSRTVEILGALGYTYAEQDSLTAFSNVVGHEMFHNFQIAHWGATRLRGLGSALVEGTTRFQETLHSYSHISHQPDSLVYAHSDERFKGNSCNDYLNTVKVQSYEQTGPISRRTAEWYSQDAAAASGPQAHTYDACLFFLTWYATHGLDGLVALMNADPVARGDEGPVQRMLEQASGPLSPDLARFAARILTRSPLVWGPAFGAGPVLDWAEHLQSWEPEDRERDTRHLRDGGMMAIAVTRTGVVELAEAGEALGARAVTGYLVGDDASIAPVQDGDTVAAPAPGRRAWLVAVNVGLPGEISLGLV